MNFACGTWVPVAAARNFWADILVVDGGDDEVGFLVAQQFVGPGLPDKTGVLADVDFRETMALPIDLAITERVARDPGTVVARITVFPGTVGRWFVVEETVEAAKCRAAIGEFGDLVGDAPVGHPVVVVPVEQDVAGGVLAGEVALGADGVATVEAEVTNGRVVRDEVADAVGAVVEDDEFFFGLILSEEVLYRPR